MATLSIGEKIKLQLHYRWDVWISMAALGEVWDVTEERDSWLRSIGPLRVNVACERVATPGDIGASISKVQHLRIGGDGRFPAIVIWLEPSEDASQLLKTISKMDTSVPRIKVMLVTSLGTPRINAVQAVSDAMKLRLDSRILYVLYGAASDSRRDWLALLKDAQFSRSITYEWFPSSDGANWSDCCEVIEQLAEQGYCFNSHPLSLCGGVAHFARLNFLARFGSSLPPNQQPLADAHGLFSPEPFLRCAFDAADLVLGRGLSQLALSCCCKSSAPTADDWASLSQYFSRCPISADDEILFEDWQYIYDGFDLA